MLRPGMAALVGLATLATLATTTGSTSSALAADVGRVAGTVVLDGTRSGTAPEAPPGIVEPRCPTVEPKLLATPSGAVVGALVRISLGAVPTMAPPTTPLVIDQRGCQYVPAVAGIMRGQGLEIRNSDGTMHNVHAWRGEESELNVGQPPGAAPVARTIDADAGELIRLGCDVHPWMSATIVVMDHAYFAVTDAKGAFSIPNLPVGQHTLEVWHPTLGTRQRSITIEPAKLTKAWFVYPAQSAVVAKPKSKRSL